MSIEPTPVQVTALLRDFPARIVRNIVIMNTTIPIPKLFINAEPGSILVGKQREFCRAWKNQKEVTVSGSHFIQEDSPHEIGQVISEWVKTI